MLLNCLPHKQEHILHVKLSPIQYQLYNKFIKVLLEVVGHLNPIKGFHVCTKVFFAICCSCFSSCYFS